jgi:hypothetical protein
MVVTNAELSEEIRRNKQIQSDLINTLDSLKLYVDQMNVEKTEVNLSKGSIDTLLQKTRAAKPKPTPVSVNQKPAIDNPIQKPVTSSLIKETTYSTIISDEYKPGKTKTIKNISIVIVLRRSGSSLFIIKDFDANFIISQKIRNTKTIQLAIHYKCDGFKIIDNRFSGLLRDISFENIEPSDINPLNEFQRTGTIIGEVFDDHIKGMLSWTELQEDNYSPVKIEVPFILRAN